MPTGIQKPSQNAEGSSASAVESNIQCKIQVPTPPLRVVARLQTVLACALPGFAEVGKLLSAGGLGLGF